MTSAWEWVAEQFREGWKAERVAVLVLIFLVAVRSFGAWFSTGQLRRVRWLAWYRHPQRLSFSPDDEQPCWRCRGRVYRSLRRALGLVQRGSAPAAARVAQEVVVPPGVGACRRCGESAGVLPFDTLRYKFALTVLTEALEPRSSTLVGRYLLPDRVEQSDEHLTSVLAYLHQFAGLEPAGLPADAQNVHKNLTGAVSAITGAVILADVSTVRARCFDRVAVWHRGTWRGAHPEPPRRTRFDALTRNPETEPWLNTAYQQHARGSTNRLEDIGDYNGRVPVLGFVGARQRPGSEGTTLVMITDETDYASTEPAVRSEADPADLEETCCKKLPSRWTLRGAARFQSLAAPSPAGAEPAARPIGAVLTEGRRAPLVNGKLCLVSDTPDGRFLVLMQRSGRTANAPGVLGPTAGGVVELPVHDDRRDGDPFGAVDVLAGTERELTEELGLTPGDFILEPSCVFLSNSSPRRTGTSAAMKGEILCTVLSTGRTSLGPDGFAERRYRASPSKGRYESDGLLFVPMGDGAQDLATALATGAFVRGEPRVCAPGGDREPIIDYLEQSALIGAIYAAAMLYGPGATIEAFSTGDYWGTPWWARRWPDGSPRIVQRPAALLTGLGDRSEPLTEWVDTLFGDMAYASAETDLRLPGRPEGGR